MAGQQTAGQAPDVLPRAEKDKARKALPGVQAEGHGNTRDQENMPEPSCLVHAKALS